MNKNNLQHLDRWTRAQVEELHSVFWIPRSRIIHLAVKALFIANPTLEEVHKDRFDQGFVATWEDNYVERLTEVARVLGESRWNMIHTMQVVMEEGLRQCEQQIKDLDTPVEQPSASEGEEPWYYEQLETEPLK